MNVAEAIAQTLIKEGVDTVFSLLGEATMHVVSSLSAQGVRVVECRHEGAALAMADGYARASGRPALCAVTAGPAFAHTLVPLTSAARLRSPVVVLTGLRSLDNLEDRQRMDHQAIARLAGAAYRPLFDSDSAVERVREVVDSARHERRPSVLDVSEEVQVQEFPWEIGDRPTPSWQRPQSVQPDPQVLSSAVDMLAGSERPVIVAGAGALRSGARDELIALGEDTGALLATTLEAKGLFHGEAFNAGIAGLFSSDAAMERFALADCVVSFGASLNSYTLANGYLFPSAGLIQVDIAPPRPMQNGRDADCYVQGDALATAKAIRQQLATQGVPSTTVYRTPASAEALQRPIDPVDIEVDPDELDPRQLCAQLDELLPPECGFATGLSGHFWSFTALHMSRPRDPMVVGTSVGAIGYGVPAGLGAALANPQRPLVVFEGDGSLMLNVHALETAARQRAPMLVVVMNNQSLGAEYYKMDLQGLDPELSAARGLDVAAVASALGCTSRTATRLEHVKEFVTEFLDGDGPFVLDARISLNVMTRTFRRVNLGQ